MMMRNPLGWLLSPVAEIVDRSLFTEPDVDSPMPATAGSATALSMERQISNTSGRWYTACRNVIEHHCFGSMGTSAAIALTACDSAYIVVSRQ
jgi:hypothetical protein